MMDKIIQYTIQQKVRVRKHAVNVDELKNILRSKKNMSNRIIAQTMNVPVTMVEHWFRTDTCSSVPPAKLWFKLKEILGIETNEFDKQVIEFEERVGVFETSQRVYDKKGKCATLTSAGAMDMKVLVYDEDN